MGNKKGFFDILFVFIILLLFLPTSSTINKSKVISNNLSEIDNIALIADSVIVDALADQSCNGASFVFSTKGAYNIRVSNYLDNYLFLVMIRQYA
jgi:hypothetical protein